MVVSALTRNLNLECPCKASITLEGAIPISNRLTVSKGFDRQLLRAEAQIFAV
jgi:hypothetical protein